MNLSASFIRHASFAGATSFLLALVLTPLAAAFARRIGAMAQAKSDRWHSRPTPLLGGVAIVTGVLAAVLLFVPLRRDLVIVIAGSAAMFLAGLLDDFLKMKPYQKLILQLVCASMVVFFGLILPWTPSDTVNLLITLFWLVGITNAVNMLDNMDGLSAGVSAIAALFLALNFLIGQRADAALMLTVLAGALIAFLVYNRHPASIFMGDSGSMFIGFFLASMALVSGSGGGRSRSIFAVLAVPVLVLLVPIFDATFVTVMRKASGRAASQGGRDHTSHRLVALGLSEKDAVLMLYAFSILAGLLTILVRQATPDVSIAAIGAFTLLLTFTGIHLARVRVYDADARPGALFTFFVTISHKRRVFEVALDVMLVVFSYYFAHVLVFGAGSGAAWSKTLPTLPVVLALQIAALLVNGVYRGIWRYISVGDLVKYVRGVVAGVAATVAYIAIFTPERVVVPVCIIDAMLLLLALTATRFSMRMVRTLLPREAGGDGVRVVIYGAGDNGERTLRELQYNAHLGRAAVAFLDDDPRKAGRMLDGLPIAAPNGPGSIAAFCRAHGAQELLISTAKLSVVRLRQAVDECEAAGVGVRRMRVEISALTPQELA